MRKLACTMISVLALLVALGGNAALWAESNRNQETANTTHEALCSLKEDVRLRRDRAVKFLENNPDGAPGIPRAVILNSIQGQNSTLKALRLIKC